MLLNYSVQAQVVNTAADSPKSSDIFLVDTNVWYWLTYTRASQNPKAPQRYQIIDYPNYIKKALDVGALIYMSNLSLAELTHLIEKSEREIYSSLNRIQISSKEYRHNYPEQRLNVVSEVQSACGQVRLLGQSLDDVIDAHTADNALMRFQTEKVDGYDLLILEYMKKNNIAKIITDDGDFLTVSGIQVFTSNRAAIAAAKSQQKLVAR